MWIIVISRLKTRRPSDRVRLHDRPFPAAVTTATAGDLHFWLPSIVDYTVRSTRWFDLAGKCKQEFDSTEKRIRLTDNSESDEENFHCWDLIVVRNTRNFDCWDLIVVRNTRNFDCCNRTRKTQNIQPMLETIITAWLWVYFGESFNFERLMRICWL